MKLPILTPKELAGLEKIKEDSELFQELSYDYEKGLSFFEAALDDESWSREHKPFLDLYVKWLTNLYFADELDLDFSEKVYRLFLKYPLQLEPYLYKDLSVKTGDKVFRTNSLLAGHSSNFLRDQIRQAAERGLKEVRLPEYHSQLAEFFFDSNRDLSGYKYEKLIEIAKSAHEIGIEEVAKDAETLAARFVREDNVLDMLKESHQLSLYHLKKLVSDFYNQLEKGFSLYSKGKDLTVIFHDLKILTTLEQYKKISSITSGIGFRHGLGSDPEINSFIRLNSKIKKLDLSQTTSPIPVEEITDRLHTLILNRAEWLNAQEIERLARRFPNIHRLELEEINYLSYEAFAAISLFSKVEELNLKNMRIGDDDFDLIVSGMPDIKILCLSGLKKLSSHACEEVLKPLELVSIDLSYTNADDALVAFLLSKMKRLEEINLHASRVTPTFINNAKRKTRVKFT